MASQFYLRRSGMARGYDVLIRKHVTQVRVLQRVATTIVVLVTAAAALMTFDSVRQFGVSLIAAAGAAGLVVGLAARPHGGSAVLLPREAFPELDPAIDRPESARC
jgi:hypothetical protein